MRVLIVDDEPSIRRTTRIAVESSGHTASEAPNAAKAIKAAEDEGFDAVFLDLKLGADDGMAVLDHLTKLDPAPAVILFTAYANIATAVEAMRRGAFDFIPKPFTPDQIRAVLAKVTKASTMERRVHALESDIVSAAPPVDLASEEPAMIRALQIAFKAAETNANILILGSSGTGKSVLAREIHKRSARRESAFVTVNCPSLSRELLESELFGHAKGSFTGAVAETAGKVAAADGGTLFLDEIGNLTPAGQMKLLRVLQTGEFERLGSSVTRRVNVRVVSATNADLPKMIREGSFREDLYFRLNVVEVAIPPLCDRPDDVLPLAEHFLRMHAESAGRPALKFTAAGRAGLLAYGFPGNVRELGNRVQRATVVAAGDDITLGDLGLTGESRRPSGLAEKTSRTSSPPREADAEERRTIEAALNRANGVVSLAATALGLSRQALYRRMERVGLSIERRTRGE